MSTIILLTGAATVIALVVAIALCIAILRSWKAPVLPPARTSNVQRELYELATMEREP